ncbi:MAG: division/cell wall cluster transcriptional repressor MraZ [Verrucomicrobia bacterium]|nr:division/cell wall cluster transcriptional repressor MraZ [Verrucomicrobiota bacterium]
MDDETTILESEIRGQRMFVGEYRHNLDPKKRLTIPSQWRAQVGEPKGLYVLQDVHHKCLRVVPSRTMEPRLEKMMKVSLTDKNTREFVRAFARRADQVSWDSQGRIRIKDDLLTYADLTNEVVLVGALDSFELWNPNNLNVSGSMDEASFLNRAVSVDL